MSQLDVVCPMILKSIKDERDAVKSYEILLGKITPIADQMEIKKTGQGAELLEEIGGIIADETKHDRAFTMIYTGIRCKIKELLSLQERK